MVLATGVTAATGMLTVLADAAMARAHVAALLAVLPEPAEGGGKESEQRPVAARLSKVRREAGPTAGGCDSCLAATGSTSRALCA